MEYPRYGLAPVSAIGSGFLAIGSESGSLSSTNLEQLRQKVEETKATLETEDPDLIAALNREDLLGDLFHAGMLGYYAQFTALSNLAGRQQGGHMSSDTYLYALGRHLLLRTPGWVSGTGRVFSVLPRSQCVLEIP